MALTVSARKKITKTIFQAKDFMEMLRIKRQRYEYLATKIGISPEVEQVEGKGRAHRYSFRNALQFAFAHHMNLMGLTPGVVRWTLEHFDKVDRELNVGIYDPDVELHYTLEVVSRGGDRALYFWGPDPNHVEGKHIDEIEGDMADPTSWAEHASRLEQKWSDFSRRIGVSHEKVLESEGYLAFRIGHIKEKVYEYALE